MVKPPVTPESVKPSVTPESVEFYLDFMAAQPEWPYLPEVIKNNVRELLVKSPHPPIAQKHPSTTLLRLFVRVGELPDWATIITATYLYRMDSSSGKRLGVVRQALIHKFGPTTWPNKDNWDQTRAGSPIGTRGRLDAENFLFSRRRFVEQVDSPSESSFSQGQLSGLNSAAQTPNLHVPTEQSKMADSIGLLVEAASHDRLECLCTKLEHRVLEQDEQIKKLKTEIEQLRREFIELARIDMRMAD